MSDVLQHALAYAAAGWPVFRLSKSKVPLKGTRGHLDATTDEATIRWWFEGRTDTNLGMACGPVIVLDFDGGPEAFSSPWGKSFFAAAQAAGALETLKPTIRTRRGMHMYFRAPAGVTIRTRNEPRKAKGDPGIDVKAHGGYVVVPPSVSQGFAYEWVQEGPVPEAPPWLVAWIEGLGGQSRIGENTAQLPAHLAGRQRSGLLDRAARIVEPVSAEEGKRVASALAAIPADGYDEWIKVGLALYSTGWDRPDGTSIAFDLFDAWSQTNDSKYSLQACEDKWKSFATTGRGEVTLGSLFHLAEQHGWKGYAVETVPKEMQSFQPVEGHKNGHSLNGTALAQSTGPLSQVFRSPNPDNPLIELAERFSVIGNLGGRCVVLEWADSAVDSNIKIPKLQTFNNFKDRFAHRYIKVPHEKTYKGGESEIVDKSEQLGAYFLKWNKRPTYEGMDLDPKGGPVMQGNILNLWRGFGVAPKPGKWPLMQRHITEVLAGGDPEPASYILRWAAWAVQNPQHQAEVALVFKGDKGSGKGTFANAMRKLFGQHGLHIFNSKHLVGQFNAHLRSCLLLFADEAFWAGDKQGESTLKGLITEDTIPIEQKGVDVVHCVNRLHVIMAANADWVVPASHDERRYAVFDVSSRKVGDKAYFSALHHELMTGGLEAMLHDLQGMELGSWHPRAGVMTVALQDQKARSLDALADWYQGVLQDGYMPGGRDKRVPAAALLHMARESSGKLRDLSPQGLGRFLKKHGLKPVHTAGGQMWEFPALPELRHEWERNFGAWAWDSPELGEWRARA